MNALTVAVLGLLMFFTIVTFGALYLYHAGQKTTPTDTTKSTPKDQP